MAPFLRTEQYKYKMQSLGLAETTFICSPKSTSSALKEELQIWEVRERCRLGILIKQEKSITDIGTLIFTSVLIQTQPFPVREPAIPFLIKWFYNLKK